MIITDIGEADFGCEERPEGMPLMCRLELQTENGYIYKEIPDHYVEDKGLYIGMEISDIQLESMLR